jgi:glycyl-tRNA synthetase beta subunit
MWYAEKLAKLLNDGTTAEELAEKLTIRRLCYEIEKLEDAEEEVPEPPKAPEEAPLPPAPVQEETKKSEKVKSFWARVSLETSSDEED